jgi:hypothetical protein
MKLKGQNIKGTVVLLTVTFTATKECSEELTSEIHTLKFIQGTESWFSCEPLEEKTI